MISDIDFIGPDVSCEVKLYNNISTFCMGTVCKRHIVMYGDGPRTES